ncbi:nucleoside 2-deoxyribosyltransferase [Ancylobacter sp. 6x-1]|uniref:Nucleoside 2-deoxyribosyltransferase n=1 Tax=Ancylobacter crimeensis TaxID=2579147 RepID=A0ABT0D8C9_9HYPH|nr:nucleoside 2-deoxyribosyltransferase [Ancylobacter crimeensis]MCK0196174.1 nucleoside 2-deoxyribosyltransferase [Ancylobacter crimeensis]
MSLPRLYLAGPEVFRPDAVAEGARLKALCAEHGLVGVYPLDPARPGVAVEGADEIRANCIALIHQCEAVVANISPFRGPHMDPGTAWELGYATARGLPVFLWSGDRRAMVERIVPGPAAGRDAQDHLIEDFGHPENLMIVPPGARVFTSPEDAIAAAGHHLHREVAPLRVRREARRGVLVAFVVAMAVALALGAIVNRVVGW